MEHQEISCREVLQTVVVLYVAVVACIYRYRRRRCSAICHMACCAHAGGDLLVFGALCMGGVALSLCVL